MVYREYLFGLQQRSKCQYGQYNLRIGSLVIPKEANLPPLLWRLGRVTALPPGRDGLIRVVVIKTQYGDFTRGVTKVYDLPLKGTLRTCILYIFK